MRKTAYNVLTKVEVNNSFVNLELININSEYMSQITIRVYGYLQNKLYLEYIVNEITDRKKMDITTKRILQMAIYEKLFLDSVPDYAIIDSYSKICRQYNRDALSFVSYVLNNKISGLTKIEPSFTNEIKNISIRYSYPQAMLKLLIKQYPDKYMDIIKSTLEQKKITGRYINENAPTPYFFDDFSLCSVGSEDFINKKCIIQDLGSYLIIKYLQPSGNVFDMCAAPGIKTLHIAKTATHVVANEINESRCQKLSQNIEDFNIKNVDIINFDASDYQAISEHIKINLFDKILVDAPCSGSGVFGSKPDLKYRQSISEINAIISLQEKILDCAVKFLKKDGELVYSTCSLNKNENEEVVLRAIEKHNLEFVSDDTIGKFATPSTIGYTIMPYTNHSDGFYMCKLKRK